MLSTVNLSPLERRHAGGGHGAAPAQGGKDRQMALSPLEDSQTTFESQFALMYLSSWLAFDLAVTSTWKRQLLSRLSNFDG